MTSTPTTVYIAATWGCPKVDPVEIVRLTPASYWRADTPDRRRARETSYEHLCHTFEEAKAIVVEVQRKEVVKYQRYLDGAEKRLQEALDLAELQ